MASFTYPELPKLKKLDPTDKKLLEEWWADTRAVLDKRDSQSFFGFTNNNLWTFVSVTPQYAFDPTGTSIDKTNTVLYTLLNDLKGKGIIR